LGCAFILLSSLPYSECSCGRSGWRLLFALCLLTMSVEFSSSNPEPILHRGRTEEEQMIELTSLKLRTGRIGILVLKLLVGAI
jgi:hypothetical protein